MNLEEAIAAIDGTPQKPTCALFARRLNSGGTLIYGICKPFELPPGINDAVIVVQRPDALRIEDRTVQFSGRAWDEILEGGGKCRA